MSSRESDVESFSGSEDSEASSELCFDIEVEDEERVADGRESPCESTDDMACADEPLADEEWLKRYEEEKEEDKRLELKLQARLNGTVQVESW